MEKCMKQEKTTYWMGLVDADVMEIPQSVSSNQDDDDWDDWDDDDDDDDD